MKNKNRKSLRVSLPICIVITIIVAAITFQITFLSVSQKYRNQEVEKNNAGIIEDWERKLSDIKSLVNGYYLYEIDEESQKALVDTLPESYIDSLGDEYAYYMSKEEYESLYSSSDKAACGIGVTVIYNAEHSAVEIITVNSKSPAKENGVYSGDLIYSVEGQSVSEVGYEKALELLAGKEGTNAVFSVYRKNGEDYESIDFSIQRRIIEAENVTYKLLEGNIGYIRIDSFGSNAEIQFNSAIDELLKLSADRFVFDVRDTSSGSLEVLGKILDIILPEGKIVRLVDKSGNEEAIESDKNCINYPTTVIVNQKTASVGEIFAVALRDYEKAILVGENTYGKGSAQSVFRLSDGSAVCITTQKLLPPKSQSFDKTGLAPDVEVSLADENKNKSIYQLTYEQDIQLKAAVEQLKK